MNPSVQIILTTELMVAILMAIGFLALKIGLIPQDQLTGISKLIVNVLLPMTIFNMVANSETGLADYLKAMPYLGLVALTYVFLFGLGLGVSKLLRLKGQRKDVFRMFMVYGNIAYFGIPLITGLYPNALSALHLTQHNVLDALVLWTVGILILTHHSEKRSFLTVLKSMMNPTMIALIIGLGFMSLGLKLPALGNSIVKGIADSLKSISLLYMGMLLATIQPKSLLKEKSIYVLILVKMILVPLFLYGIASLFFVDQSAVTISLMFGLPGMILVSILVALYGSDKDYAAGIVFMTTIASLITLPLLVTLFSMLHTVLK